MKFARKCGLFCMLAEGALFACGETISSGSREPEFKSELTEHSLDWRAFIASELAAKKKKILLPPGRYRVRPVSRSHLRFQDLQNVEIIADHVEIISGVTMQAIGSKRCTNVTLRGLTVDYDPLSFKDPGEFTTQLTSTVGPRSTMLPKLSPGAPQLLSEEWRTKITADLP